MILNTANWLAAPFKWACVDASVDGNGANGTPVDTSTCGIVALFASATVVFVAVAFSGNGANGTTGSVATVVAGRGANGIFGIIVVSGIGAKGTWLGVIYVGFAAGTCWPTVASGTLGTTACGAGCTFGVSTK